MLRPVRFQRLNVSTSQRFQKLLLCLLSATLLILSFPRFDLEFLAWFSFIPLFFALQNTSKPRAFSWAYLTGVMFWAGAVYWLVHVTLLGTVLLVLYLAIYFGIFGIVVSAIDSRKRSLWIWLVPSAWVLLEYCRSHLLTGFPWALVGYSQYRTVSAIQIASITGVWGVSFIVMLANAAVYLLIRHKVTTSGRHTIEKIPILVACICIIASFTYGLLRLRPAPNTQHRTPITISVIQANIPQDLKWYPGARSQIMKKYLALSQMSLVDHPDLVIWPEAALPVIAEEEPAYFDEVTAFARKNSVWVLLGAVTARGDQYYNSALLVSSDGEVAGRYDKIHLVPFGEYIPLKKFLPFLETIVPIGDVSRGTEETVFGAFLTREAFHGLRTNLSVLICFEDVFPELSRCFVRRGATLLVNVTNDGWYKKTSAAYQHFQASVFRAVENNVIVVRSANTGISGFIGPHGEIISFVQDGSGNQIFVDGYKTEKISIETHPLTLYTRFGDWFILFCAGFVIVCLLSERREIRKGALAT